MKEGQRRIETEREWEQEGERKRKRKRRRMRERLKTIGDSGTKTTGIDLNEVH